MILLIHDIFKKNELIYKTDTQRMTLQLLGVGEGWWVGEG